MNLQFTAHARARELYHQLDMREDAARLASVTADQFRELFRQAKNDLTLEDDLRGRWEDVLIDTLADLLEDEEHRR